MKVRWIIMSVIVALFVGCYEEDEIQVNDESENHFVLPNDHEFDKTLIGWNEAYGFYPLYKFEPHDFYWRGSLWDDFNHNDREGDHVVQPGNPDYVEKQIEMIETAFMEIYPDELLKHVPVKMLLCSELYYAEVVLPGFDWDNWVEIIGGPDSTLIWAYKGYDFLAINGASKDILTMTLEDKQAFLQQVNTEFLRHLGEKGALELPQEFFDLTTGGYIKDDYDVDLTGDALFINGFLSRVILDGDGNEEKSKKNDAVSYLQLAAYSLATLNDEPDRSLDDGGDVAKISWVGAFSRDPAGMNGICGKKYQVVINYLKSLGVKTERLQNPDFTW